MDVSIRANGRVRGRRLGIGLGLGVALILALPVLAVGAGPPSSTVPPLLGTAVSEDGQSLALFGAGDAFTWVNEGGEVAPGLQLVRVASDHVTVRQESTGQELQVDLGSGGSFDGRPSTTRVRPPPPPPPAASRRYTTSDLQTMSPQQLDVLNQQIKAKFEKARAKGSARDDASQSGARGREDGSEED